MVKILKFFEANLTLGDLEKTLGGEKRGDILVRKLNDPQNEFSVKPKSGKHFRSNIKNSTGIVPNITTDGEYDSKRAKDFFAPNRLYRRVFQSDDDKMFALNDIEKTSEFGSSGGSSLGTTETRIVETIQCMFFILESLNLERGIVYDFDNPKSIQVEYFLEEGTDEIRRDILARLKSPSKIDADTLRRYRGRQDSPTSWWKSFCFSVEQFYSYSCLFTSKNSESKFTVILPLDFDEVFHHVDYLGNDSIPKKLKQKFKEFVPSKAAKFEKWNPSDVYVVSSYHELLILEEIDECRNLNELNALMEKLFDEKKLRGISLKKTKKEQIPDLIINNTKYTPEFTFNSFKDSTNPLDTISLGVICDVVGFSDLQNKLDLRSFGGGRIENISGEVSQYPPRGSKQGKISLTGINDILERNLKNYELESCKVPTTRELKDITDDQLIEEIRNYHRDIFGNTTIKTPSNLTRARLISKYQSIYFGKIINTVNKKKFVSKESKKLEDIILTEIMNYALSIKNIHFDSSVYVRIL